jgi:hypothetical protein
MIFNLVDLTSTINAITAWSIVIVLGALLVYFLKNPEKIEKWVSLLARLFSFLGLRVQKVHIQKDIQASLNSYRSKINKECEDLIPYKTEIRFLNASKIKKEDFIHEGDKIILILKDQRNQDDNFIRASLMSTQQSLIPHSRPYIEPGLMKSVDYHFVKNLITSEYRSRLNKFLQGYLLPEIKKNKTLSKDLSALEKIGEEGLFTRVLLQELRDYGLKLFPKLASSSYHKEPRHFFEKVDELANKKQYEDIPLSFDSEYIKTRFILVGRPDVVLRDNYFNIDPYKKRAFLCESEGAETLYLLGRGISTEAIKDLVDELDRMPRKFEKNYESNYIIKRNKRNIKASCVRYTLLKNVECADLGTEGEEKKASEYETDDIMKCVELISVCFEEIAGSDSKVQLSKLQTAIIRKDSSFTEKSYGFKKFKDFIKFLIDSSLLDFNLVEVQDQSWFLERIE